MSLAWHNLFQDRLRSALSIAGVGLALMLILILGGFLAGVYQSAALYLDHAPGSLVVARKEVKSFLVPGLALPSGTADRVRAVPGVAGVTPLFTRDVFFDLHGTKQSVVMIGYDATLGGGPWDLVAGRQPQTDTEIVVDQVLTQQHNLSLGSTLTILGRTFTVVGISAGTSTWSASFVFIQQSAAQSLLLAPEANFLLITPSHAVSVETLRDWLRALPDTEVFLKSEVIANDVQLLTRVYSAPIQLMVIIAYLVGILVIGLILYTATAERQAEYGVLKAIGARNWTLYRVVVAQAGFVGIAGTTIGVGLALGAAQFIMAVRPQFLIAIEPLAVLEALAAALVMALLAALAPARMVARLAPADVFRR